MSRKYVMILTVVLISMVLMGGTLEASTLGSRTLQFGSRGDDVAELQKTLNGLGFWTGPVDGIYGKLTEGGVINFQIAKKIRIDGIAGPQTFGALNISQPELLSRSGTSNASRYSASDLDLLARLVRAEAGGESYLGQVAVAATVLNRVKSSQYPNTIRGVIYQVSGGYIQYCPVRNGTINQPANASTRRAVEEAINGSDPSKGALSFYNPRYTSNAWILSRPRTTVIGNHVFVR
ncbi:cell wall hydrolase [Candidatus Contubernalis alkaliaceticus]|uniref:cell wall hydrolase n=1 Tax=Candidatus Contubernalis alkaliaceticus TaxID=338645 RepID=UPI001F4BE99B|nr:cell wall hydrolase [Candidatus Contubernalis alkalaceticus]UNC92738.1 cell wall hydrolase [Candidatus Contubernalis alkalaceticus]